VKARVLFATGVVLILLALALPGAATAAPPTLTLDPVSNPSIVTAHVSGEVEVPADGLETFWCFEYTEAGAEAWSGFCFQGPVSPGETAKVNSDLGGLKAEQSYEVRLAALNTNDFVEEFSAVETFETDPAVAPALTLGPAEGVTATGAHLSGTIDPEGGNEDAQAGLLPISWELQVNRENAEHQLEGWNTVGSGELSSAEPEGGGTPPAASTSPIAVAADASGLIPNSHYQFRLLAHYAGLQAETPEGGGAAFETEPLKPDVERETLWEPTETSIQLNALVNAHNSELTDCHFEWGAGSTLDHSTPCEAPYEGESFTEPSGEGFTEVSARISGLAPGTDYSFRLVAANATGTEAEDARSFESLQEPAPESCPNAAIRHQQHADQVPDCRAYEMATPVEKGNGDIAADPESLTTVASSEGDALAFNSRTPFGDTVGSGFEGHTTYLARRSSTGWASHGITPMANPEARQTGSAGTLTGQFAEDLSSMTVWAYDLANVENDTPKRRNIYAENTLTRGLEAVTTSPPSEAGIFQFSTGAIPESWGQSADGRHIAFEVATKYLPEAAENAPNVYQWDEGVLSLAGILPDGSVPASGSWTKTGPASSLHTMSADGSRELFYASTNGEAQLYQRIDGNRTVWISEAEDNSGSEPAGIELQAASPDGRAVLFTSATPLIEGEQGGGLYRWKDSPDPANERNLTFISGFGEEEVIGMTDDGTRIYLTHEVWNEGEVRRLPGMNSPPTFPAMKWGVLGEAVGLARVSHGGRYLAFLSGTGFRGAAARWKGWNEFGKSLVSFENRMYLYDFHNDTLRCTSCNGAGGDAEAIIVPLASRTGNTLWDPGFRPRFLAEDGRVFFSTAGPLVGEDVNGLPDAYEYDPVSGAVRLLSTGRGEEPITFADASISGNDVFLATRQSLAWPDSDDLVDIYDVRHDGGFPEPPSAPAPCEGEGCQPSSSAPGVAAVHAASQASGRGNLHRPARRCSKRVGRRHRRSRHCGKRSHRHPQNHKPTANVDGRTSK
jgi:hypothetical protein